MRFVNRFQRITSIILIAMICVSCGTGTSAGETNSSTEINLGEETNPVAETNPGEEINPVEETNSGADANTFGEDQTTQEQESDPALPAQETYTPEQSEVAGASRYVEPSISFTSKEVTLYDFDDTKKKLTLYFADETAGADEKVFGGEQIPYITLEDGTELINHVYQEGMEDKGFQIKLKTDTELGTATMVRENGQIVQLDFISETIVFPDFNGFFTDTFTTTRLDGLMQSGYDKAGQVQYFQRKTGWKQTKGSAIAVSLQDYGIPMVLKDGQAYLPLATFSDLFLSFNFYALAFNGSDAYLYQYELTDNQARTYGTGEATGTRSEALAKLSYQELCMVFDLFYGLKTEKNITTADAFFTEKGYAEDLQSLDGTTSNKTLAELLGPGLNDLHSYLITPSPYATGVSSKMAASYQGSNDKELSAAYSRGRKARKAALGNVPFYQEVGNTAFVTFDSFDSVSDGPDYYAKVEEAKEADGHDRVLSATKNASDTLGKIAYAQAMITRENSPVQNVVLDLSLNTGGDEDLEIYTTAWMLGQCQHNYQDVMTGDTATTLYAVDTNFDHLCNEADTLDGRDLNLYCLISGSSFSCANATASMLQKSGKVTLVGTATAGGACTVQPLALADGTCIWISGRKQSSYVNAAGQCVNVETGVAPDVEISDPATLYDRTRLAELLKK